jgi:hypothetical protein
MKFSLLALFGFVTFVAVFVRIAVPYPELATLLVLGLPISVTLLICIVIGVVCPVIALMRWIRGHAKLLESRGTESASR